MRCAAHGVRGWLVLLLVLLLILLLILLLAGANARAAQAQSDPADTADSTPVTLEQYVRALQSAQAILVAAEDDETPPAPALAAARAELQTASQVLLPSGALIAVNPLLGEPPQELSSAAALQRIAAALDQLGAAGRDDTAARLDALARVLAGAQFNAGASWFDAFWRWLSDWWSRLFPERASSPAAAAAEQRAGDLIWSGIGIVGVIALVLLLAYWLRGFLGSFIGAVELPADGDGADDLPQTPAEARRRAAGLAAGGDFRSAVRNLYLSALLTLEQNGLAPADRSLTNREVLRRVPLDHPVRSHLQPVVDTFDEVWYGVHEPDDQTYRAYTHSINELETLAARPVQEKGP